ncbi:NADPH:quinone oxidoreductase family protein [Loktanella sp. IMCC34160]|uniref:NADPH:quinone oxidoreductase family protein n=1 Tax=Loktanella sp. IMCC34160 TaxID=2510646 RepID=UPI00101DE42F|nr:NADPH:quinone oxidoreductase family protein [Loktanella sp. IMCC34160]RYG89754.1 NADPH:quinone oxidoreductase family protein [Loktanella sp. IMCC34160]
MTHKAFRILASGGEPTLTHVETPMPAKGEVRLKIEACGLNFADLLMAKGTYQDTPPAPFTLGLEVCGTVIDSGPETDAPPPGTRVAVFSGQGGLAEEGLFPADRCIPVPDTMDPAVAAGFQVAYGTSHLALTRRARLRPGERLVVTGAAGGVGLTAIEIGKALGAEVVAIARGADKLAVAQAAGADHVIDATTDPADITARIKALGGADVVYDVVGGDLFTALFKAANREARLIVIGFAGGEVPKIPANHLLVKNIDVIGFYWGGYMAFNPEALTDSMTELMRWHAEGRLKPHISHSLPLDRAGDALALLADRKSTGKVVVTMGG